MPYKAYKPFKIRLKGFLDSLPLVSIIPTADTSAAILAISITISGKSTLIPKIFVTIFMDNRITTPHIKRTYQNTTSYIMPI